jgi:hypothetical protein
VLEVTPDLDNDLRSRVVQAEHRLSETVVRIAAMELWKSSIEVTNARRDEQWTNMLARLNAIDNNIKWVGRLVVGGVILGVLAFVLRGGLYIPAPP